MQISIAEEDVKPFNYINMKRVRKIFYIVWILTLILLLNVSCKHIPTKPLVEYDLEDTKILIIQTDTAAHDSAYISIGNVYKKVLPIKDTTNISVREALKSLNQIEVAYQLATQNYQFEINVHTTRTNDTTFIYKYRPFDIKPINVAQVVSGQCRGLYDVNYKRDYHGKIRQWIFKNDLTPDSAIIERTNSILRQFNYSGKNEYSAKNEATPIVTSLSGMNFKFNAQLEGEYFYLYAYPSQSGTPIKSFVESKITKGLVDAHKSVNEVFSCSNSGGSGPNVIFLIGIDKNWKYVALPVGIVVIDDIAPHINAIGHAPTRYRGLLGYSNYSNTSSPSWPRYVTLKSQNMQINIPDVSGLTSSVSVSYGNFEGNDYFGYNIPFYISVNGDVKSITIGSHKLDAHSIKNGECIRLHMKKLHIGDNSLPLSAIDSRGNIATSSLSIPIVSIRNNSSYHDNDDYDDLEDRISDLESRMEDLE